MSKELRERIERLPARLVTDFHKEGYYISRSAVLALLAERGATTREPDPTRMLADDNNRMRKAGNALAAAALRVTDEYDGVHRLRLAVADWSKAVADEGGRGEAPQGATGTAQSATAVTMASALHQAAEWFQEYAGIHDRKGDEEKSRRNQERANFCFAALLGRAEGSPQPAEPRDHSFPFNSTCIGKRGALSETAAEGGDTLTPETPPDTAQIVEELRADAQSLRTVQSHNVGTANLMDAAADRLEAQAARIAALESHLQEVIDNPWIPIRIQIAARRALVGEEAP